MSFLKTISTQDQDLRIRQLVFIFAADSAASDTRSQEAIAMIPSVGDFTIYKIWVVADGDVTQDAGNYATLTFKRVRMGEDDVTIGTKGTETTTGTEWGDNKAVELVDCESFSVANRDVITWEVAKAGDGVQLPSGMILIEIENSYSYVG